MSTQWTTPQSSSMGGMSSGTDTPERYVVLLLYGKNSFGDKVYSYLRVTLPNLPRLKSAILAGNFIPSDFGSVIAAGRDEPTEEVRAEVASLYQIINARGDAPRPTVVVPVAAAPKKAWDEY